MQAERLLKKYTQHQIIELTSRGNTAIFASLYCARKLRLKKKTVLIPDQGGWLTYKKYPKMLELVMVELKTNLGIIDVVKLKETLAKHDVNCMIYQNPAGYYARQPMKEIYETCNGKCSVILDASGALSDPELCNGEYADIMVGSFGRWKPVEVGYGGFVSFKRKEDFERSREIFNTTAFDDAYLEPLQEKLLGVPQRLKYLYKKCETIKHDLSDMDIAHMNKKGINVVVMYNKEAEKQRIINYCERHKYEYTQCPRYIRIMKDAISIEVKRLR